MPKIKIVTFKNRWIESQEHSEIDKVKEGKSNEILKHQNLDYLQRTQGKILSKQ